VQDEGVYWAAAHAGSCILSDTVVVDEIPSFVTLEDTVIMICEGRTTPLSIFQPEASIQWSTGENTAEIIAHEPGTYTVNLQNVCETGSKTFIVEIDEQCCTLSAPNVFTPNADHKNDEFEMTHGNGVSAFNLEIVNRWGGVVFTTTDADVFWNGRNKGEESAAGVYFWTAVLDCDTGRNRGRNRFKGTVFLRR
jgi:gliding motility-associated-like protein